MNDDLELSRQLTKVVATTAGVSEVYASGSVLRSIALDIINGATADEVDDAKIAVHHQDTDAVIISATIGVDSVHPVTETLRSVSDAIREYLNTSALVVSREIDVKVSYIA